MNKFRVLFFSFFLFHSPFSNGQTFWGDSGSVSDDGMVNYFNLQVSGLNQNIDTAFGITGLCFNITHTWDDDLVIWLKSPDNTLVELASHNGGGEDNYEHTCFNMDADTSITQGIPPFTGLYIPEGNIGDFNNGQNPNGTWQLVIVDEYPYADQGYVLSWHIKFMSNAPAPSAPFISANLPLVLINTNGQLITDPVRITAGMHIIDNGGGWLNYPADSAVFSGSISIEKRGSSSITFPQPSYSFETQDSAGNNLDTSLLGMPAENDWILYGPYNDKSLVRDALIYRLSNDIGRYASRTAYCEVLLNNSYQGVYVLEEKIKQDANRVDIAPLQTDDTTGDQLTGGYIMKVDKFDGEQIGYFASQYKPCEDTGVWQEIYFQYHDPPPDKIVVQQQAYIQSYADSFEDALKGPGFTNPVTGFRKYADDASFIDHSLLNELAKNVDAYRWSAYFYKDKYSKGGKIHAGPIWDFNISFGNADYYDGWYHTGWQWDFPCPFPYDGGLNPFWWKRLLQDTLYYETLKCRWQELRSFALDTTHIFSIIDSFVTHIGSAKERHFTKYPILGIYTWPNAYYPPTYEEEIDTLKNWIAGRIAWMDEQLTTQCATGVTIAGPEPAGDFEVFPNPAAMNQTILLQFSNPEMERATIFISDLEGKKLLQLFDGKTQEKFSFTFSPKKLKAGFYFITIKRKNDIKTKKIILME